MRTARTTRTVEKGDWKPIFVRELARTGIVGAACKKAKIGRTTAYKVRGEDEAFAAAWDAALDDAIDGMEAEAWRRGKEGTLKPVFQGGAKVGHIREYSDTLLIFMLKAARPEKYRDRQHIEHTGRNGGAIRVETYDYSTAIAPIAAGSDEDSDASGQDPSH